MKNKYWWIVGIAAVVLIGIAFYLWSTPINNGFVQITKEEYKVSKPLEFYKNQYCQELIGKNCNVSTKSILLKDFDANKNGILNETRDNLFNLCKYYYGCENETCCKINICGCVYKPTENYVSKNALASIPQYVLDNVLPKFSKWNLIESSNYSDSSGKTSVLIFAVPENVSGKSLTFKITLRYSTGVSSNGITGDKYTFGTSFDDADARLSQIASFIGNDTIFNELLKYQPLDISYDYEADQLEVTSEDYVAFSDYNSIVYIFGRQNNMFSVGKIDPSYFHIVYDMPLDVIQLPGVELARNKAYGILNNSTNCLLDERSVRAFFNGYDENGEYNYENLLAGIVTHIWRIEFSTDGECSWKGEQYNSLCGISIYILDKNGTFEYRNNTFSYWSERHGCMT
jgi:hypothetical protein